MDQPFQWNEYMAQFVKEYFSVAHGWQSNLKQHSAGDYYVQAAKGQRTHSGITQFTMPQTSSEADTLSCYCWLMCLLLL